MPAFLQKFLIVLFIGLSTTAFGQSIKSFSSDKDEFFKELGEFIAESNADLSDNLMGELRACWPMDGIEPKKEEKIYKEANKLLEDRFENAGVSSSFEYSFTTPKFTEYQIQMIIETSNKMLENRLKPVPHFDSYLISLLSIINTRQSEDSFDAWNVALNKLLEENRRYFIQFIESCNDIFLRDAIYVSRNVQWLRSSNKFEFDYDSLPKVVFSEKMTISCIARDDTSKIHGTAGVYYPTTGYWYGYGGKVFWTRAKKDTSMTNAILGSYRIEVKSSEYEADSVIYKNEKYLDYSIIGKLKERMLANQTPENCVYPQFYSYSDRVKIEEIKDSIDYEGGFVIHGGKFIGRSEGDAKSKIIFKKFKKPFLVAEAQSFLINDERISTQGAEIKMYLDTDSIYHPYLQLKFLDEKRELTLYREDKGIGAAPYYNTFHKMDMYVEWLKWDIDEPYIEFSTIIGSSTGEINLESNAYYSPDRFNRLQGLQDEHPLYTIKRFIIDRNNDDPRFYDTELASFMTLDDEPVKRLLVKLATQGFLNYDVSRGIVQVQDRLFNYLKAKSNLGDYDNISIQSIIKGQANATMNLVNYDITIRGVAGVALSEKRKTGFMPENGQFKLHRNRDMTFGGIMRSGNYEMHGKRFEFNYNEFKVELVEVDSLRMLAENPNIDAGDGQIAMSMVRSVIEDISGDLKIDYPMNKSGIRQDSFPEYPIIATDTVSYVRYNKRNKQGASYDPKKVYFRLEPFEVDSLGSFSNEGIAFPGTFKSGGIFPEFEEDLVLMPDHSLGFKRKTPPGGYPMFGGKATFTNDIMLSNEGLRGDGDFEYITSLTKSNNFIFFLDSMKAAAQSYTVEPQVATVEYTDVQAERVMVDFYATDDYMSVRDTKDPMKMYNGEALLKGELIYGPKEMTGNGLMDFENAELTSDLFVFKNIKVQSDTADFKLKAEDVGGIAFATNNVNATIDFEQRMGDFLSNGGGSYVDFPVNQYICYMDQFKWFMDKFELQLSSSEENAKTGEETAGADLDLSGSEFISTRAEQDSLKFISPKANYDLKKYIIKAHEVKYINVADARIYTSDGEVVVEKNAKMTPLEGAKIVANVTTKYHTITDSKVNIKARRDYTAEGDYQYVDGQGNEQLVHFNNIRVDTIYQTVASGEISADQNFMLSPMFSFKGQTSIQANTLGMHFKGGTQLVHDCKVGKPWVPFEADIDPKNVQIPIAADIKSMDADIHLGNGVAMKMDSTHVYGNFLAPRKYHSDPQLIAAEGYLQYDNTLNQYQISNKDKLNEINFPGNFTYLNTETCVVGGEGEIDLDEKLGQVKFEMFGNMMHNPNNDSVKIDGVLTLDFFIDDAMWKNILDNVLGNPALTPVSSRTTYERALRDMVGKEEGDKLVSELGLYGQFKKVIKEIEHNFVFSEVNMYWDAEKKSFISDGAIGLAIMGNKQINRYVNGYIELHRSKAKEELNIYIEIDDKTWYFFSYVNGVMRCISSEPTFNAIITDLKDDKRESKGTKSEGPYTFMLGTERAMKKFLSEME